MSICEGYINSTNSGHLYVCVKIPSIRFSSIFTLKTIVWHRIQAEFLIGSKDARMCMCVEWDIEHMKNAMIFEQRIRTPFLNFFLLKPKFRAQWTIIPLVMCGEPKLFIVEKFILSETIIFSVLTLNFHDCELWMNVGCWSLKLTNWIDHLQDTMEVLRHWTY